MEGGWDGEALLSRVLRVSSEDTGEEILVGQAKLLSSPWVYLHLNSLSLL